MMFHDTCPGDEIAATREREMKRLIRLLQEELNKDDAISVPAIVSNVVAETQYTPAAANRIKERCRDKDHYRHRLNNRKKDAGSLSFA
jgi:hypothetical protein